MCPLPAHAHQPRLPTLQHPARPPGSSHPASSASARPRRPAQCACCRQEAGNRGRGRASAGRAAALVRSNSKPCRAQCPPSIAGAGEGQPHAARGLVGALRRRCSGNEERGEHEAGKSHCWVPPRRVPCCRPCCADSRRQESHWEACKSSVASRPPASTLTSRPRSASRMSRQACWWEGLSVVGCACRGEGGEGTGVHLQHGARGAAASACVEAGWRSLGRRLTWSDSCSGTCTGGRGHVAAGR